MSKSNDNENDTHEIRHMDFVWKDGVGEVKVFFGENTKGKSEAMYLWGFHKNMPLVQRHGRISRPRNVITSPPGSLVLKVAEFLCSPKLHERVFLQAVLDMRDEYNEALFQGQKKKAQWVLIRGYLALTWTVALQVVEFLLSGPVKVIKSLWG
jgi:hypothetical protein